jgi:hypothetical protein
LELPWNVVVTSCFHEVIDRALATEWRTTDAILTDQRTPANPRSRTVLHVLKLFGCVTSDSDTEQPPVSIGDLLARQAVASNLLSRLTELVTPRGILVVDAVTTEDWLNLDKLAEHIATLGTNQTHFFGSTPELEKVRNISYLAKMRKVTFHRETLYDAISDGKAAGLLSLQVYNQTWVEGVELTFRSGRKQVFPPAEWRKLTK